LPVLQNFQNFGRANYDAHHRGQIEPTRLNARQIQSVANDPIPRLDDPYRSLFLFVQSWLGSAEEPRTSIEMMPSSVRKLSEREILSDGLA